MSADAKVWHDEMGWHGICDAFDGTIDGSHYDLTSILKGIEEEFMKQPLHWEIFQFKNGLGLRGYRAKSVS